VPDERDRAAIIDAIRTYGAWLEDACKQEVIRGDTAVKKRTSAKVAAQKLCRLIGLDLTEEEAWRLADMDPPMHDTDKPLPGARIDAERFYYVGRGAVLNDKHVAAVRVRPHNGGFEAASGNEVWGRGMKGTFQKYVWTTLHGVFSSADKAEAKLAEVFGMQLRKDQPQGR
jgi:hypothetical protein